MNDGRRLHASEFMGWKKISGFVVSSSGDEKWVRKGEIVWNGKGSGVEVLWRYVIIETMKIGEKTM